MTAVAQRDVPEVLVGVGGVTVSCFGWARTTRAHRWSEAERQVRLARRATLARVSVLALAERHGVPLSAASTTSASRRVAQAHVRRSPRP